MAKALLGHLVGDTRAAGLAVDNAVLRRRIQSLTALVAELQEALTSATAVADGRLVDLVTDTDAVPAAVEDVRTMVDVSSHAQGALTS